jgi:serine/threonine protein kinase
MMRSAESDVPVGTVIDGKYRVDGIVGRGGMGTVYRAQHLALHEPVAIKILRRDAAQD